MNIILFTKYIGSPLTLRMGHSRFYVMSLSLILAVCAGLFYAGYWLGQKSPDGTSGLTISGDKTTLVQNQKYEANVLNARNYLAALEVQLAINKAQIVRIEALGERLIQMAKLDPKDFNFSSVPSVGGPQPKELVDVEPKEFLRQMPTVYKEFNKENQEVASTLADRELSLNALESQMMHATLEQKVMPSGSPIKIGYLSSNYGTRRDPFSGRKTHHDGIDYAARIGTPIHAVADGIVTASSQRAGYGFTVEVDHGKYVTRYAHNSKNLVTVGQKVRQGDKLALMGTTGRSTGPHVHFEVITDEGKTINPHPFVKNSNIPLLHKKVKTETTDPTEQSAVKTDSDHDHEE